MARCVAINNDNNILNWYVPSSITGAEGLEARGGEWGGGGGAVWTANKKIGKHIKTYSKNRARGGERGIKANP